MRSLLRVGTCPGHLKRDSFKTRGRYALSSGTSVRAAPPAGRAIKVDQTNNSYIFPGVGLGDIAAGARRVTGNMFMAAAKALAELSPAKTDKDASLLPPAASLGEMPTSSLCRLISPLRRSSGLVRGEPYIGQGLGLGIVHQGGEFGDPRPGPVGDLPPLLAGGFGFVLGEGDADPDRDDPALGLAGVGQGIAHEVDPAALPRRAQDLGDGGLQPLLRVRDHQLGGAQAAAGARVIITSRSAPRRVTRPGRR